MRFVVMKGNWPGRWVIVDTRTNRVVEAHDSYDLAQQHLHVYDDQGVSGGRLYNPHKTIYTE